MPITIQEIIASDTLSQVADKINFNFDQILLNGGGPVGPAGPLGPPGPIGGRGERGSEWYEDPNNSATNPNTIIVSPDLLEGDFYLDFDGNVWEYNGTIWNQTTVNLKGPAGSAGQSLGWGYFGQVPNLLAGETSLYLTPMPNAAIPTSGADQNNQAVPTTVIAAVPSTQPAPSGLTYTSAYRLSDDMATAIESTRVSMLINQRDSGVSAIKLKGGGSIAGELYEQDDIDNLVSISVGVDDSLDFSVPKSATSPTTTSDLIGYNVRTTFRGQRFSSGKQIEFLTGLQSGGGVDSSDFLIDLKGTNPKFEMGVNTGSTALIQAGPISVVPGAAKTGNILIQAKDLMIAGDPSAGTIELETSNIMLDAGNTVNVDGANQVNVTSKQITLGAGSTNQKIVIQANPTGSNSFNGLQITSGDPTQTYNFGNTPAVLNGSGKIEMRSDNSMRIMSLNEGISIQAGFGATSETLTQIAFGGDLKLFASQTQDTSSLAMGDVIINNGTFSSGGTTYFRLRGGGPNPGQIVVGDGPASAGGTMAEKAILKVMSDGDSSPLTDTIRIGRARAKVGSGVNLKYYGGGEIVGPQSSAQKNLPGSNPQADKDASENEFALHMRSSLDNDGLNPGAVWLYVPEVTGTIQAGNPNGDFLASNLRIWSTNTTFMDTGKTRAQGGTTIGINQMSERSDFGGDNVKGRITLYGRASQNNTNGPRAVGTAGAALSQDTDYPGNGTQTYAGVNVGDFARGRQTFKVFGDYVGDHFTSAFGGVQSGPGGEVQCFLSGGQIFGSNEDNGSGWINNAGTNNADDDIVFQYKYSWSRTGRVVTGAGTVKIAAGANGGTSPGSGTTSNLSQKLIQFHTGSVSAASEVIIGPINLPLQVAEGSGSMCSTDRPPGGSDTGTRLGIGGGNISGVVTPNFDYINANTLVSRLMQYSGTVDNSYSAQGPLSNGVVRAGSSTSILGGLGASNPRNFMWLKIYPNHQNSNSGFFGIIPAVHNFTFTYTLNV